MKKTIIAVTAIITLLGGAFIVIPKPVKYNFLKRVYITVTDVKGNYETISLKQVKELLDKKEATLLDVRGPSELKADGYVEGSLNIPIGELESKIAGLDKGKTYITFCTAGGSSAKAASILSKHGFKNIYNAEEGMISWPYEKIK